MVCFPEDEYFLWPVSLQRLDNSVAYASKVTNLPGLESMLQGWVHDYRTSQDQDQSLVKLCELFEPVLSKQGPLVLSRDLRKLIFKRVIDVYKQELRKLLTPKVIPPGGILFTTPVKSQFEERYAVIHPLIAAYIVAEQDGLPYPMNEVGFLGSLIHDLYEAPFDPWKLKLPEQLDQSDIEKVFGLEVYAAADTKQRKLLLQSLAIMQRMTRLPQTDKSTREGYASYLERSLAEDTIEDDHFHGLVYPEGLWIPHNVITGALKLGGDAAHNTLDVGPLIPIDCYAGGKYTWASLDPRARSKLVTKNLIAVDSGAHKLNEQMETGGIPKAYEPLFVAVHYLAAATRLVSNQLVNYLKQIHWENQDFRTEAEHIFGILGVRSTALRFGIGGSVVKYDESELGERLHEMQAAVFSTWDRYGDLSDAENAASLLWDMASVQYFLTTLFTERSHLSYPPPLRTLESLGIN